MDPAAAGNLSSEAAKGVFQEVKRRIRYVTSYKKNVDKFEESHKRLTAKRDSVLPDVPGGAAEMNVQEIEADVQSWCDSVKTKIEEEEKKVKDLEEKAKNKCFIGLCPSIKSRYRLSRKAEEGATAFEELIQQCQFTGPEENDEDEPLTDFEPIESREKVFNDIMEAVKDNSCTSMIGVHGKGGVGKTTLLKEVVRQVKKAKLFDWVIMVAIAENPIILTIQKKCAEVLDIEWRGNIVDMKRAFTSCVWLSKKRFLLVIDDLWAKLDFSEVGIPLGDLDKENRGNKILLASRDHNVLLQCQGMYAQNIFSISLLDDKEAWDLFQKKVEVSIQSISPDLQTVGSEIAKRCGGLPVAISAVARTLRFKDPSAWTDASRQLQRSSSRGLKEISPAAYSAIKLSYNYIEGEKFKQFFVFCNLLSHNTLIQDLLKYTIGLGLLPGGCGYIVEEARATLLTWVSSLKASGLLLNSYNFEHFDIHDNICDVAISIASTESNRLLRLKREDVLKDWPDVEAMKQHSWINLRIGSKTVLPGEVECPQLTFLNITGENCSTKVPPEFFKEMKSLQVLDLTAMELSCFPSSIGLLSTLQTLCLHGSCLGDIAVVGELKALEILSLLDSDIERLPKEIGKLVKLRWLDLSGCTKLKIIPAGLLSRLTKLEELYMRRSFTEWEADGDANQGSNASLDELSSLSHLTTLEVHIRDAKLVRGNFFFFRKLERYKILIGEMWKWTGDYEYSRTLKLDLNSYSSISHLHLGIKMLLEGTEDLYLGKLDGVKIALHEFIGEKGFPNLKNLHIKDDFNIRYIIPGGFAAERNEFLINLRSLKLHCLPVLISFCSGNQRGSASKTQHNCLPLFGEKMVFPCLEELEISVLHAIDRVWDDKLSDCNPKLTSLIIVFCYKLKHILSASMARSLVHLKYLEVQDCKSLREIISSDDVKGDEAPISFPRLNTVELNNLQHLIGFCSENLTVDFVSLKLLKIKDCPKFKGFIYNSAMDDQEDHRFSSHVLFNKELNMTSVIQRTWHDRLLEVPCYAQNLTSLTLKGIPNLRCLYSSSMAQCFLTLENLEIVDCENVVEVIFVPEEDTMLQIFPKLGYLLLKDLKKLERFCHGNQLSFSSLKMLRIKNCPSFRTFVFDSIMGNDQAHHIGQEAEENNSKSEIKFPPLFNEKVEFPVLKNLTMRNLVNLKRIWDDQQAADSFCNLEHLEVKLCRSLLNIFPSNMLRRLQKLRNLEIAECCSVEEIIEAQGIIINARDETEPYVTVETIPKFEFPQLTYMRLYGVANLKSLYGKMHTTKWPSLKYIELKGLYHLEMIFGNISEYYQKLQDMNGEGERQLDIQPLFWITKDTFPCLEEVRLDNLHHFLHSQLAEVSCYNFLNLRKLEVKSCQFLDYVFSLPVAENFVHLESLTISECLNVKEVIIIDEVIEEKGRIIKVFPRLQEMKLYHLPRLMRFFCFGDCIEFPMLSKFVVNSCLKLTTFVTNVIADQDDALCLFNDKVAFPRLQKLEICTAGWKKIWHEKLTPNSFGELNSLTLRECDGLFSVFPSNMVDRLQKLEYMHISSCKNLKSIIEPSGLNPNESFTKFVFPQIRYLELESLSKLKSFYPSMHTTEWPALKKMRVGGCNRNVKIFALKNLNSPLDTMADQQPLFWFSKDTFPCLIKELTAEDILEVNKHGGVYILNKN